MIVRNIIIVVLLSLLVNNGFTQVYDSLKIEKKNIDSQIKELKGQLKTLQSSSDNIKEKLLIMEGWRTGIFSTLGFNQSTFNNWIKGANPNSTSSTISVKMNGFANKKSKKYFWRSAGSLNLGWQKLDIDTEEGEGQGFENVADVLKLTSIFGFNITENIAFSGSGEYNTAVLSNFNNPGVVDFGTGITWVPDNNVTIAVHPLNYHWVFGDNPDFNNSLGAKIIADLVQTFPGNFTWRSNLTTFFPYQEQEPSLMEFTWTNGVSYSAWKGVGIGVEYAIRSAEVEFNGIQSFFVIGLSYALQR